MTRRFKQPLPFGAELQHNGLSIFRLFAPAAESVDVETTDGAHFPMSRGERGIFAAELPLGGGARYRYRIDRDLAVPDPASRAQENDVHGFSLVVDPEAYVWRNGDWPGRHWQESVLYETHVGLEGGFNALAKRLPKLAALGITALELMPLADFRGQRNWGYDGVLPFAPDRSYGAPDELKALVDAAHGLGLMVFLDVVYNHFGPDGNYLHRYAPDFFRPANTPWGDAINVSHDAVDAFYVSNALYWLNEYRFDGLRFDAMHAIENGAWIDRLATQIRRGLSPGRHVHLVLEHDGNVASHLRNGFEAQWNDDIHHALHVLLTGERSGYYADYAGDPAAHLARCLGEGFAWQGEPSPHRGGQSRGEPSGDLCPTRFVSFLQNHDQVGNRAGGERIAALTDKVALRAATVLLLLSPQIPLLFVGQEWGSRRPFHFFTDFEGDLAAAVRDGRRREFASFDAFASDGVLDPNAADTFARSRPHREDEPDADEWLDFHAHLLELRQQEVVPRLPGAKSLSASAVSPRAVRASWRMGDGTVLSIVANFDRTLLSQPWPAGRIVYGAEGATNGAIPAFQTVVWIDEPARDR